MAGRGGALRRPDGAARRHYLSRPAVTDVLLAAAISGCDQNSFVLKFFHCAAEKLRLLASGYLARA
jgi:hypothetical protein